MTQQEMVEQNIRMLIGDLQLQLIFARARIAELENDRPEPDRVLKPNGKGHDGAREAP